MAANALTEAAELALATNQSDLGVHLFRLAVSACSTAILLGSPCNVLPTAGSLLSAALASGSTPNPAALLQRRSSDITLALTNRRYHLTSDGASSF
jgi:hypothetical protein